MPRPPGRRNIGAWISVAPSGKLRLGFRHAGRLYRPVTQLEDTPANRRRLEAVRDQIGAEIRLGTFDLGRWFPSLARPKLVIPDDRRETLGSYYARWIERPHGRASRVRDYRSHWSTYLHHLSGVALADLSVGHLSDLRDQLAAGGGKDGGPVSPKTIRNAINGTLRAMIRDARERDDRAVGWPFPLLRWERYVPATQPVPMTHEERDRVLAAAARYRWRGSRDPAATTASVHAYLATLLYTGRRPSAAAALRVRDVDLSNGVLVFRASRHLDREAPPKSASEQRECWMPAPLREILSAYVPRIGDPSGHLFRGADGGPLSPNSLRHAWELRLLPAANVAARELYGGTKDTAITLALADGEPSLLVAERAGISLATLHRHYARWMPRTPREAPAPAELTHAKKS